MVMKIDKDMPIILNVDIEFLAKSREDFNFLVDKIEELSDVLEIKDKNDKSRSILVDEREGKNNILLMPKEKENEFEYSFKDRTNENGIIKFENACVDGVYVEYKGIEYSLAFKNIYYSESVL